VTVTVKAIVRPAIGLMTDMGKTVLDWYWDSCFEISLYNQSTCYTLLKFFGTYMALLDDVLTFGVVTKGVTIYFTDKHGFIDKVDAV
jgi:hypothetical protein